MVTTPKILAVVGTRPEAVKVAPVVLRLRQDPRLSVRILTSGQHRALLDQALADFSLTSDRDLDLMRPGQTLTDLTARALTALGGAFASESPDLVMAQGDTTTVLCAALASFYARIPFAHIEAGLRTGQLDRPFPEEANRVLASHLASLHFAPTPGARANLLKEGIPAGKVHVTGNTVIDALTWIAGRNVPCPISLPTERFLLVTAHRRESFGEPMARICDALLAVLDRWDDLSLVFPVHPNPAVKGVVEPKLAGHPRIRLVGPLSYPDFVATLKASELILTDSGGVQEEAPSLGKPVLVLREETERPEAIEAGTAVLVGTDPGRILAEVERHLDRVASSSSTLSIINPYGDGFASERIARRLLERFHLSMPLVPPGYAEEWVPPARKGGPGSD